MKHLFSLLFAIFMVNVAMGQINHLDNRVINKNEIKDLKGAKELTCEINAVNFFASNANNILEFTILASGDSGDSLAMTFPAGVTPITGQEIVGQVGDWNEEILNGVDGQVISWGGIFEQSPEYQGGIRSGELYEFWVEVDIDASITESFEVDYFVDAAGYGTGQFEGTVTVLGQPTTPDLFPSLLGYVKECYKMPLSQAVITPQGRVENAGGELTEATDFNIQIGTSYDENMAITIPMGTNATEDFTFPELTITEIGSVDFTYIANATNDAYPENGTVVKSIEVTDSILSFHNGDVTGSTGYGIPGGVSANVFTINAEDVLTAVSFYLSNSATNDNAVSARIYAFDGTPGDFIAQTNDVQVTAANGSYSAVFPAQVILEPGTYLIGIVDGNNYLGIAYTSTPYIENSCWALDPEDNEWHNQTGTDYANTYAMEAIFGTYQAPDFDVALEKLTLPNYVLAGDVDIAGTLKNMGGEVLTSIDIEYTINGGTPVTESLSGLNVASLATYDFVLSTPAYLTETDPYTIAVHINNGNGLGPDANPNNDDLSTTISVVDYIPAKRVVVEEGTGTWCGWCVRGHVYMDSMAMKYPETFIGIASHNSDPMVVPAYNSGISPILQGFPNTFVGRSIVADPLDVESAYYEEKEVVSPATIVIENKTYDENTRELTFTLTSEFVASVSNFRFNAVIVENEVSGTSSEWSQANNYSGGGAGPMGGYENLPDPVPAADMVYQDVARALLGGFNGTAGSLPASISAGETHSYEFTTTINSSWDINHIEVVGMVINQTNGKIENACIDELLTGVEENETFSEVKIYPNPATDVVNIELGSTISHIEVFNYSGAKVIDKQVNGCAVSVNTSVLHPGVYIFKITNREKVTAKQIVII